MLTCGGRRYSQIDAASAVESLERLGEVASEPIDEIMVSSVFSVV